MNPSSFESAIRLQFDCLARKVVGTTVKDYNRELGRRAKRETPFCELSEMEINHIGAVDEYSVEFTAFDVFGNEVRIYDERLCEAIKKLAERRIYFYFWCFYGFFWCFPAFHQFNPQSFCFLWCSS